MSPLVGLLQSLLIILASQKCMEIFYKQVQVWRLRRLNRQKFDLKKLKRLFPFCKRRRRWLLTNLTILFRRPISLLMFNRLNKLCNDMQMIGGRRRFANFLLFFRFSRRRRQYPCKQLYWLLNHRKEQSRKRAAVFVSYSHPPTPTWDRSRRSARR